MMNSILIILSAFFLLVSCQKDNAVQSHDKAVATFEVQTPFEFEIKSTTGSVQDSQVNALWYGVYHKKTDGRFVYMSDMSDFVQVTDINDISVPITLFKDQEYKIIFVAQHIEAVPSVDGNVSNCYTYIINENGQMSLNPSAVITDGEQLEAFVYVDEVGPINGNEIRDITLNRIVSQVNIGTSADVLPNNLNITVSGVPAAYDIFNGIFSEDKIDLEFQGLAVNGESMKVNDTDYTKLTTLYLLGSNRISLTVSDSSDTGKSTTISNVETKVNYKTNIAGRILYE